MSQRLNLNPYLTVVTLACIGLAGATTYFLLVIPKDFAPNDPDWLVAGASWATAFVAQFGVFLGIIFPVIAHALSGRWSWSVRVFTAISAYWVLSMAMLAINAYEDMERLSGRIQSPADLFEGVMTMASIFLLYFLLAIVTFVWIATRGKRFHFDGTSTPNSPSRLMAVPQDGRD